MQIAYILIYLIMADDFRQRVGEPRRLLVAAPSRILLADDPPPVAVPAGWTWMELEAGWSPDAIDLGGPPICPTALIILVF